MFFNLEAVIMPVWIGDEISFNNWANNNFNVEENNNSWQQNFNF